MTILLRIAVAVSACSVARGDKIEKGELSGCELYQIDGAQLNLPGMNGALLVPDERGKLTSAIAIGSGHPEFDPAEFQRRLMVAIYLDHYDRVAWKTSDAVSALIKKDGSEGLSADWFVYFENGKAVAVYGRYDEKEDRYIARYAFIDEGGKIRRHLTSEVDPPIEMARAIHGLAVKGVGIAKNGFRVNWYIQKSEDGAIRGFILPATLAKDTRVYCHGWSYVFSSDGRRIVDDSNPERQPVQQFHSGKAVKAVIDEHEQENPSIAALFFLLRDSDGFESLMVENQKYRTFLFTVEGTKGWIRVRYPRLDDPPRATAPEPSHP
jgi:hypothetical protein